MIVEPGPAGVLPLAERRGCPLRDLADMRSTRAGLEAVVTITRVGPAATAATHSAMLKSAEQAME